LEEIREVRLPEDRKLLENFVRVKPIEFLSLNSWLKENVFPEAYAGISEGHIKTLATIQKGSFDNEIWTLWPSEIRFVEPILEKWGPPRGHISLGVKHLHSVLNIYRPIHAFDEIFIMIVDKEHFIFKPKCEAERLKGEELPKPWKARKDYKGIAYGICANGEVISCGSVENIYPGIASTGGGMITDPAERGKGYATSTMSYAVRDALDLVPIVTYPVETDNTPAIIVLQKLGFR